MAWCRFRQAAWVVRAVRQVGLQATLYGGPHRVDNPREHHEVDALGAGPEQRPRAGVGGGAGRQHIVDQHQPAPGDLRLAVRRHAEGALYVLRALGLGEPDLLRRRLDALERRVVGKVARRVIGGLARLVVVAAAELKADELPPGRRIGGRGLRGGEVLASRDVRIAPFLVVRGGNQFADAGTAVNSVAVSGAAAFRASFRSRKP